MPEESAQVPVPENKSSVLDKNVPNPLAKNPNVHTHKVFASVGLILIGVIVILSVLAYMYRDQVMDIYDDLVGTADTYETTKVSTSSATPSTTSETKTETKDETADWKTFTSKTDSFTDQLITINYSYKAPNGYTQGSYEGTTISYSIPNYKEVGGVSDPGEIQVLFRHSESVTGNLTGEKTTLGGKVAYKTESTNENGSKSVIYTVASVKTVEGENSGFRLTCLYMPKSGEDIEKTCDLIASTFKFL